jgi:hypothetical protein
MVFVTLPVASVSTCNTCRTRPALVCKLWEPGSSSRNFETPVRGTATSAKMTATAGRTTAGMMMIAVARATTAEMMMIALRTMIAARTTTAGHPTHLARDLGAGASWACSMVGGRLSRILEVKFQLSQMQIGRLRLRSQSQIHHLDRAESYEGIVHIAD